jgi:hypothetical protein
VRDYSAQAATGFEIVDFEIPFDYARAQIGGSALMKRLRIACEDLLIREHIKGGQ